MKRKAPTLQHELGLNVFNLFSEVGEDPDRIWREKLQADQRAIAIEEAQRKWQRTFEQCPGYVGGDLPDSHHGSGKVVIEPGRIMEAVPWLKRRFHVNENLELSNEVGICVEVKPRVKRVGVAARSRNVFEKPKQFEMTFA